MGSTGSTETPGETTGAPTGERSGSALLWMHGLGDTEEGWSDTIQEELKLPSAADPCKYVFPRAPTQFVTCNMFPMTSWFDMKQLPIGAGSAPPHHGCSLKQAETSATRLREILDDLREKHGVPPHRIVIGGFSQGGAMAMLTTLTYPHRLAACVCFSGVLLGQDQLETLTRPEARGTPVFWGHGSYDDVLEPSLQEEGVAALTRLGLKVTTRKYPMSHSAHPQEFLDVAAFLQPLLSNAE